MVRKGSSVRVRHWASSPPPPLARGCALRGSGEGGVDHAPHPLALEHVDPANLGVRQAAAFSRHPNPTRHGHRVLVGRVLVGRGTHGHAGHPSVPVEGAELIGSVQHLVAGRVEAELGVGMGDGDKGLHAGIVSLPLVDPPQLLDRVKVGRVHSVTDWHTRRRSRKRYNRLVTVAYVISSYRNPGQVLRLVSALREGPEAEVVVRHDQRRTALSRGDVEDRGGHLLEDGIDVRWGEFSYLRVLLGAFEWALERLQPDWIVVLSGEDYPLRPPADIEARLGPTPADAFLSAAWELPTGHRPEPPVEEFFLRYAYRHF